jgi:hypothetical protein
MMLASASCITDLRDLGIERAITLWPEWGPTFTQLDKRTENRPMAPPRNIVGQRVAFHNGTYLGGRKGGPAGVDGVRRMLHTATTISGWNFNGSWPSTGPCRHVHLGSGTLTKGDARVAFDGDKIPLAAITFTAIITGFSLPTRWPTRPWQFASSNGNRSYGWHVEQVVVLTTPIPCSGLQGFWPLKTARQPGR